MALDVVIILLAVAYLIEGLIRGFMHSVLLSIKTMLSFVLILLLGRPVAEFLNGTLVISSSMDKMILTAVGILTIFVALRLIITFTEKSVIRLRKRRWVKITDRVLGFCFGVIRFAMMLFIVSFVVYVLDMHGQNLQEQLFDGSRLAKWVYDLLVDTLIKPLVSALGILGIV
jgi:uncharacterized membrane protein required for colicin V production